MSDKMILFFMIVVHSPPDGKPDGKSRREAGFQKDVFFEGLRHKKL